MVSKLACPFLLVFLTACAASPKQVVYPTRTPDPIQAYVDANSSQGTAVAAIATADYFSNQLTATVEARNQTATQQVVVIQSTQQAGNIQSTERAWNATTTADSIQSTSIAMSTASAAAQQAIWTQRAVDITATADIAAVQAYATEQYSIARTQELTLERETMVNQVRAVVPWAMFVITFVILAFFFRRWTRVRVIQRDSRGDAPLLLDVVDGVAYDADRNPASTEGLEREDLKRLPQFSSRDHIQTTARDQMLDLATRGLLGTNQRKGLGRQLKNDLNTGGGPMPKIEAIDAGSARPLFKDVIPHIVQDSIDAEVISEEEDS
jgi:hypothetical protein